MKRLLIIALFVCTSLLVTIPLHAVEKVYGSRVGIQPCDQKLIVEGKVGHHFSARIIHVIGWHMESPSGSGLFPLGESYVTDPEYILFGSSLPPGLTFDSKTGMIEGTPTTAGKWQVTPGVRCKKRGNNVYRGVGHFLTVYKTYEGKVWTASDEPFMTDIKE